MRLIHLVVIVIVLGLLLSGLVVRDQEFNQLEKKVDRLETQLDILRNYVTKQFNSLNTNEINGIQILNINWETGDVDGIIVSDESGFSTDD